MDSCIMSLNNISKSYANVTVLEDINISIEKNECMAVCGMNGCGKSTLLKIIAGISSLSGGERKIHLPNSIIKIGYVPEHFPKISLNPLEYLVHMGKIQGMEKLQVATRVKELFDIFNISSNMQKNWIRNLSKGTIQKVSVIQAILETPDLLILDEPLSGQDINSQDNFVEIIKKYKEKSISIILTCHENDLVEKLADRVVIVKNKTVESDTGLKLKDYTAICFKSNNLNKIAVTELLKEVYINKEFNEYITIYVPPEKNNDILRKIIDLGCYIHSVKPVRENIN